MQTVEPLYIGVGAGIFGGMQDIFPNCPKFAWKSYMKQYNITKNFMRQTFLVQIFCSWWLLFNSVFSQIHVFFTRVMLSFWVRHIYTNVETSVPECPIFFGFHSNFGQTKNFLGCACTTTAIVPKVCNLTNHEMLEKHKWAPVQCDAILNPNFEKNPDILVI